MARSRSKLTKIKRVKAVARKRVGSPKPTRVIAEKTRRPESKPRLSLYESLEE